MWHADNLPRIVLSNTIRSAVRRRAAINCQTNLQSTLMQINRDYPFVCIFELTIDKELLMMRYFFAPRYFTIALALIGLVAYALPASAQRREPSGVIQIEIVSGGFILGIASGNGILTYQGRQYPLGIGGLSVGATIGAAKTELVGSVYNLSNVSDLAGTYTAGEAGLSIAGGRKVARLRNSKGVVLRLRGRQIGFEATLDLSGMEIWLK